MEPGEEITPHEEDGESVFGYESSLKVAMIIGAFILVTVVFVLAGVGFYRGCTKRPDP